MLGGWHGALTTPAIAHSHRFTAPGWSDLRGSEEEEVLRLRFWHLYNDGKGSRWPKTDMCWLVFFGDLKTLLQHWFVTWHRERERLCWHRQVWRCRAPMRLKLQHCVCKLLNPDRFFSSTQWARAILNVSWCSPSDSRPRLASPCLACPGYKLLVTAAFLWGHYWMNTETRLAVNGQFGYTAVRLELLRVMYRLSTCQLYKGGSRLCKCVCK